MFPVTPLEKPFRNPTQKHAVRGLKPAKLNPSVRALLGLAVLEKLESRQLFADVGIDTSKLADVMAAYQADTRDKPVDWDGSISFTGDPAGGWNNIKDTITGGVAGTTSQAFRDAELHRANYFRRMAGLGDIQFSPQFNQWAQERALFGSAYHGATLDKFATSPLVTPGAQTAGPFGAYATNVLGADAFTGLWIDGPSLEHRNLFLNPRSTFWGIGNVPAHNGDAAAAIDPDVDPLFTGQAMIYAPPAQGDPARETRRPFVAWPPPKYSPIQILQSYFSENNNSNWNFNYEFADFTDAQIKVTRTDSDDSTHPVRVDFISDLSGQERSTTSGRQDAELQWRLREDTLRVGSVYHVHVTNFFLPGDSNPHEQKYDVKPIDGENPAALHVTQPVRQSRSPVATLVPASQAVRIGSAATFTAEATGAATVQWQVSTNNGNTWSDIPGATDTTLNVPTIEEDNGNRYQAVFTNDVTTFIAGAATGELEVQCQVSTDSGATYSNVPAAWLVNNKTSLGSYFAPYDTTSYLSVPQGELRGGDRFQAVFTNESDIHVTTDPYTAYLNTPTPAVTPDAPAESQDLKGKLTVSDSTQPANQSVLVGDRATFTSSVSGNTPTAVEWEVSTDGGLSYTEVAGSLKLASDTVPISPISTLSVPQVLAGMSGNRYRAIFTFGKNGIDGRQVSRPAQLTVSAKTPADMFIDAGGRGAGNYAADYGFSGTSVAQSNLMYGRAVIKTGVPNLAPETVYRSIRPGTDFTYTIGGLAPGQPHTVMLDFAALFMERAGSRRFDVYANQGLALADVGPIGGGLKFEPIATRPTFQTVADVNGVIRLRFLATVGEAMVNGIRITQGGATPTIPTAIQNPTTRVVQVGSTTVFTATAVGSPTPTVQWQISLGGGLNYADLPGKTSTTLALPNVTASQNGQQYRAVFTNTQHATISTFALLGVRSGPAVDNLYIDAGGSGGGSYVGEANFFVGGGIRTTGNVIDTSAVPNPAPQTVNQSLRIGNLGVQGAANFQPFSYVVPSLIPGATYTVSLDFAEQNFSVPGARVFDVSINDAPKLTRFYSVAEAGQHKLVRRSFDVAADANGIIVIRISAGGIINAISFVKNEQPVVPLRPSNRGGERRRDRRLCGGL